jgi:hypothetical protein
VTTTNVNQQKLVCIRYYCIAPLFNQTAAAAASAAAVTVALAISIQPTRKKLIYSSPFRSMPKICMPFKEFEACMSVRLGRDSTVSYKLDEITYN